MLGEPKPHHTSHSTLSGAQVLTQLERVLASDIFARSERLSSFLRYIVERTLDGSGHILKEQVIAQDVFGRLDFDSAADPIVRVEARRLRDKLREYYAAFDSEPVVITLPKGAYVPSFERNPATMPAIVPSAEKIEPVVLPGTKRHSQVLWLAAVLVVFTAATVWYALRPHPPTPSRVRRLTSLPGSESFAGLSPDGNFVVFAWGNSSPPDLYIKAVDSEDLRRLTETPEPELSPAWSPDGRDIAFVRGGKGVFIVTALGGAEREIADTGHRVGWSSDAKSVFVGDTCPGTVSASCVYQIALDTLERRQITKPAEFNAAGFAASPDGRTLAVVGMSRHPGIGDIYLVPLTGGGARRLTTWNRLVNGVAWTPDSRFLFYSLLQRGRFTLWRTTASGGQGNGDRVTALDETAVMPSVARGPRGQFRVAYQTLEEDVSLRLVELNTSGPADPIGTATPFADATEGRDCGAKFSPDASQIIFGSFRSGEGLFWLVRRDGTDLHPLMPVATQEAWLRGAQEGYIGGYAPDGRRLVFDLVIDGNDDIYTTDVNGSRPVRITSESSLDLIPAWSADGKWIYFVSDRSGTFQIWKVPAGGGPAIQITFHGGFQPQTAPDGKYVYYMAEPPGAQRPNVLKRVPSEGGEESALVEGVSPFYWSVTKDGIYLLTLEHGQDYVDRYDPATGHRTRLGMLPFRAARGFCGFISVSQNGRFLVANHVDRYESNLGLIDGFR